MIALIFIAGVLSPLHVDASPTLDMTVSGCLHRPAAGDAAGNRAVMAEAARMCQRLGSPRIEIEGHRIQDITCTDHGVTGHINWCKD